MNETPPDDPEQPTGNVSPLRLVPFVIVDRCKKLCDHRDQMFIVDASDRTCECKGCGRQVDPYLAIARVADDWGKWRKRRRIAIDGILAVEERLATLKADLADLQSQVRSQRSNKA